MTTLAPETLEQAGLSSSDIQDAQADAVRDSYEFMKALISVEALPEVCESFGAIHDDGTSLDSRLAWMGSFAARHLDFRQGRQRADTTDVVLTERQEAALIGLGDELDMTGMKVAVHQPADIVLAHGSYRDSMKNRLLLTREIVEMQRDRYPEHRLTVVGAASDRELNDGDRVGGATLAPYARTERHVMDAGFTQILKAWERAKESEHENVRQYDLPGGAQGLTLSGRKIEGTGRPNTADTYHYTASVLGAGALIGAEIVGVTTQVYSLFQEADMRRILGLGYGARIQMTGFHDAPRTEPHHIGQEFKSAIDQTTLLHKEIQKLQMNHEEVRP